MILARTCASGLSKIFANKMMLDCGDFDVKKGFWTNDGRLTALGEQPDGKENLFFGSERFRKSCKRFQRYFPRSKNTERRTGNDRVSIFEIHHDD